jgi:hypothetical protein
MALMPDQALLYKVIDMNSLCKDADGMEAMLLKAATEASGGALRRIIGCILDNTKVTQQCGRCQTSMPISLTVAAWVKALLFA